MIVLGLTDIHGVLDGIQRMRADLRAADLVLLVGDITHFGGEATARRIIKAIRVHAPRLLAVPGNCDYPEVAHFLDQEQLNLHRRCQAVNGTYFVGVGGSLPCPGPTPFELGEDDFRRLLAEAVAAVPADAPTILVAHQPPFETASDRISAGVHVGSRAIRTFITQRRPLVCFTGHIHEGTGIDHIGSTAIINPGPLRHGRYAYLQLSDQVEALEIRAMT
jgi:Icc-related predicted phosphoesterase